MVRAPCCEKMGLKRGPWTPEEDRILVSYIQNYGHDNWRALPKLAGLLRCGKSCRLRWINYLKPDIKRGNFSKEEEDMIIQLHGLLGNRWSMIAAKLPGRTDNEIKNVWHTHLKKRVNPGQSVQDNSKRRIKTDAKQYTESSAMVLQASPGSAEQCPGAGTVSPSQSYSGLSSESNATGLSKEECMDSAQEFPEIDESFWSEALSMDYTGPVNDIPTGSLSSGCQSFGSTDTEDMSFWLSVFMEAGGLQELPEI